MHHQQESSWEQVEAQGGVGYEPPGIEIILTPESLEREVLYAGRGTGLDP